MKKYILSLFFLGAFISTIFAWTNPLTMKNEWQLYGIGDPFILKYRGTYYLYASTRDNMIGVKCWSTKDFVTWSDAYMCSTDEITKTAYAPEVLYWNGTFYMYTSPGGNGHFVLSSQSPKGPFVPVKGNFGKSIDGSVFVEDDGRMFFFHADGNGIMGSEMSSPTTFGASVNLNARMGNNWTEGPCLIKRNGVYYLFYTGNHVISKGYRTDYAINKTGPLSSFAPQATQNPILIKTEGDFVGLGHGSAFIGPDLDSYYFTYHNLAGDYGVGPYRRLNFDRIAWNGEKMLILGPTTWEQQPMQLADMADFFDRNEIGEDWTFPNGGNWTIADSDFLQQNETNASLETYFKAIQKTPATDEFTAEFTLREAARGVSEARYGVLFSYFDEENYGVAALRRNNNQIEVKFLVNNVWSTPITAALPLGFNHSVWHSIRVEKLGSNYKIFVDGMLKVNTISDLKGGRIGYFSSWSQSNFGYIAFSNKINGSGIFDVHKPVPGTIEAVHYNQGEGIGYSDSTQGNSGGKYTRNDHVDIRDSSEGGHAITDIQSGEWLIYNFNVKSTGVYNVGIRYATASSTGKIKIWQGETAITDVLILPSTGGENSWRTLTIKDLQLMNGNQTFKIEIVNGGFDFYRMQFVEADNSIVSFLDEFNNTFSSNWNYSDGTWAILNGQAVVDGYGKRTFGSEKWSDYVVQTDVSYTNNMNGGIIFRVNNPALGGAGRDPVLGTDFYQGYFVTLGANSVVLGKQNYNWTALRSAPGSYSLNTSYKMKVEVEGANIKVYVDDMETPKIDFTDPNPFISGKVGLRSHNAYVKFDNFSVTTTNKGNPTGLFDKVKVESVELFPNPVSKTLNLSNVIGYTELSIYDINGRKVYKTNFGNSFLSINVSDLTNGMYLLQLKDFQGNSTSRKFLKI